MRTERSADSAPRTVRRAVAVRPEAALARLLGGAEIRFGARVALVDEIDADLVVVCAGMGVAEIGGIVALGDSITDGNISTYDAFARWPDQLARRLVAMTSYLADLKRQYADSNSHLALMDKVLVELMGQTATEMKMGSERSDQPDY